MKIVKLKGGLGNQMFEYAFGKVIQADAYEISFFYEQKFHPELTQRDYELDFFKLQLDFIDTKEIKKLCKKNKFLSFLGIKNHLPLIQENPISIYNPKLLQYNEGLFDGYFQCAQYYENIRDKLLKDFVPNKKPNQLNEKMLKKIKTTNSISLHVRRGDYVKLQHYHGLCDIDYYKKAIEFIASKVSNPHFFLFSDDIPWVEENLKIDFPYTIIDYNQGSDSPWDMWLMKNCYHNIIANSSFSWWGAWLNENPDKIVIAPQVWMANGRKTDIIPINWVRI